MGEPFSFCGGFTRDFGSRPYNDIDISTPSPDAYREQLNEMGLLKMAEPTYEDPHPHDIYFDPYDFSGQGIPIHFIYSDHPLGFAPNTFDYGVNEFSLKSNMLLYAPTYAWREKKKQILRYKGRSNVTTNVVLRGIRFSAKLGYQLTPETIERFREFFIDHEGKMASNRVLSNIDKMVEDNVGTKCFELLKEIGFPLVEKVDSLEAFRAYHNDLILNGKAVIEEYSVYD